MDSVRLANIRALRADGYTIIPPYAKHEFSLPTEDATALEVAQFIERYSYRFEANEGGKLIRPVVQDRRRYEDAFELIDFEAMFANWTDEEIKEGIDAEKRGAWNMVPEQRYNEILNSLYWQERERRFPTEARENHGMTE